MIIFFVLKCFTLQPINSATLHLRFYVKLLLFLGWRWCVYIEQDIRRDPCHTRYPGWCRFTDVWTAPTPCCQITGKLIKWLLWLNGVKKNLVDKVYKSPCLVSLKPHVIVEFLLNSARCGLGELRKWWSHVPEEHYLGMLELQALPKREVDCLPGLLSALILTLDSNIPLMCWGSVIRVC